MGWGNSIYIIDKSKLDPASLELYTNESSPKPMTYEEYTKDLDEFSIAYVDSLLVKWEGKKEDILFVFLDTFKTLDFKLPEGA